MGAGRTEQRWPRRTPHEGEGGGLPGPLWDRADVAAFTADDYVDLHFQENNPNFEHCLDRGA